MSENITDAIKRAWKSPADYVKAFTQSNSSTSGITAYNLQPVVMGLYPADAPLRNMIARVPNNSGIEASWRAITGINTNNVEMGVSEGHRGGVMAVDTMDFVARFRSLGLEDYVTFEANLAAQGFDDLKARAVRGLLQAVMVGEEKVILGGNGTMLASGLLC